MTVYKFAPRGDHSLVSVHRAMAAMFQILTKGKITHKEIAQLPVDLQDLFDVDYDFDAHFTKMRDA